jgi:hypothetical protein
MYVRIYTYVYGRECAHDLCRVDIILHLRIKIQSCTQNICTCMRYFFVKKSIKKRLFIKIYLAQKKFKKIYFLFFVPEPAVVVIPAFRDKP